MAFHENSVLEVARDIAMSSTDKDVDQQALVAFQEVDMIGYTGQVLSERLGKRRTESLLAATLQETQQHESSRVRARADMGLLGLWVAGFDAVSTQADMATWRQLATSDTYQQHLAQAYNRWYPKKTAYTMIGGRAIVETFMLTSRDDQEQLNDEAAYWGSVCSSAWARMHYTSPRLDQPLYPVHHAALGAHRYLAGQHKGDAVRAEVLEYSDVFAYSPENAERYFYHRLRRAASVRSDSNLNDPDKLLSVITALTIDDSTTPGDFITGMKDKLICMIEELPEDAKRDSDRSMRYLGGASQLLFQTVEWASGQQGNTRNDMQKIYLYLKDASPSGYRLPRPKLSSIVRLANGFTQTINQTVPLEHALAGEIHEGTIDGYYEAFDRVLFVVNTLVAHNNNDQEARQFIGDLSDIITSLIKIGSPRTKDYSSLRGIDIST